MKHHQLFYMFWIALGLGLGIISHTEAKQSTVSRFWYVVQEDTNMIAYAIDPTDGTSEEQFRVSLGANSQLIRATLSPDGQWLSFIVQSLDQYSLQLMNTITGEVTVLTLDDFLLSDTTLVSTELRPTLDWSPDSRRLLIHVYDLTEEEDRFYLYDTVNTTMKNIELDLSFIEQVQWSDDGQRFLSVQLSCIVGVGCEMTGAVWDANTVSVIASYDTGDFAYLASDSVCELRWTDDERYVARVEYCGITTPDERREVYVYDTVTLQGRQVTNFTEGATLTPPYTTAQYSLHWSNNQEFLIGLEHQTPASVSVQTLRYNVETDTLTDIDTLSGEDWVSSPNGQYIAYRTVNDYERSSYSARVVDDTNSDFEIIYEQPGAACDFMWSRDSHWLAYVERNDLPYPYMCSSKALKIQLIDMENGQAQSLPVLDPASFIPLGWVG